MPLRNEAGEIVRWFGTLTDISERKRLEDERERLLLREQDARAEAERRRDELERVTESRARLIRGFSHDVKNPLGAADGYLHLMGLMNHLTDQQQERVGKVRRSIKAALNLIEDLLELAHAEAGTIEVHRAPTDVRAVAEEAADEYRAQAEAERLSLTIELPDTFPVIESDAGRIRQVLGNLLSNAVKYTERGGITVKVKVCEGEKAPGPGRWIAVDVSDTGPGISKQQHPLLFQEFHRLETAGGKKGAGIGLAISRRIAQALDGDMSVASEVGKGSTFTLWLPTSSEPSHALTAARRCD
jgi:signal transduction histidine kinase